MKHIAIVGLLSLFLITGCGQSSNEEPSSAPAAEETQHETSDDVVASGEPITLHARFEFMDSLASPSINSNRQLNASLYIETDVIRDGSGANATYTLDSDESRVQGVLSAFGSLDMKDNEISSTETYNMRNTWGVLTKNPEGKFFITLPEASMIGEGLSVGVELEVPVTGIKKATISSAGQTIDGEIMHSRSMFCATQTADKDICTLKFTIDAAPTKAQAPGYEQMFESAKSIYPFQGKKNADGGVVMYSGLVPVYGAATKYNNGNFVTELNEQYQINMDGSDISQHIHLVVWSTKRGDIWQPEGLPPLQKPEALQ